jgi:hypothetical protein
MPPKGTACPQDSTGSVLSMPMSTPATNRKRAAPASHCALWKHPISSLAIPLRPHRPPLRGPTLLVCFPPSAAQLLRKPSLSSVRSDLFIAQRPDNRRAPLGAICGAYPKPPPANGPSEHHQKPRDDSALILCEPAYSALSDAIPIEKRYFTSDFDMRS